MTRGSPPKYCCQLCQPRMTGVALRRRRRLLFFPEERPCPAQVSRQAMERGRRSPPCHALARLRPDRSGSSCCCSRQRVGRRLRLVRRSAKFRKENWPRLSRSLALVWPSVTSCSGDANGRGRRRHRVDDAEDCRVGADTSASVHDAATSAKPGFLSNTRAARRRSWMERAQAKSSGAIEARRLAARSIALDAVPRAEPGPWISWTAAVVIASANRPWAMRDAVTSPASSTDAGHPRRPKGSPVRTREHQAAGARKRRVTISVSCCPGMAFVPPTCS
jgi:hypothetical protein